MSGSPAGGCGAPRLPHAASIKAIAIAGINFIIIRMLESYSTLQKNVKGFRYVRLD